MSCLPRAAWLALLLAPSGATASNASQVSQWFLFVPPIPSDPADSAYVIAVAQAFRSDVWDVGRMLVIGNRMVCEDLDRYDYDCEALLTDDDAERLAAVFGVAAYVTGRLQRDSMLTLELRLHDRKRTGFSGRVTVDVAPDVRAEELAEFLSGVMQIQAAAGQHARACYEARDEADYETARAEVDQALYFYPTHPAAGHCLATVFELTGAPSDSLIMAYGIALAGEPDQPRIADRLMALLMANGDSVRAAFLMTEKLNREPANRMLRMQVSSLWLDLGHPDWALSVLPSAGAVAEQDPTMIRLMARVCMENTLWVCQLDALDALYAVDPNLTGDTTFYFQAIGVAQLTRDLNRVLSWVDEAISQTPSASARAIRSFRRARAAAWNDAGQRDSALAVYRTIHRNHPDDARSVIAMAGLAVDERFVTIDSTIPLDTNALFVADSLLRHVLALTDTTAVREAAASLYTATGTRLVQAGVAPHIASRWLENGVALAPVGQAANTARALNALALFHLVRDLDGRIREERSCALVAEHELLIERARASLASSDHALPELEGQVLLGLDAYAAFLPDFRAAFQCGGEELTLPSIGLAGPPAEHPPQPTDV